MNETPEELAELSVDILTEGIDVHINIGRKEVVAIVGVVVVTNVISRITIGTIGVLAKRKLAKIRNNEEEES